MRFMKQGCGRTDAQGAPQGHRHAWGEFEGRGPRGGGGNPGPHGPGAHGPQGPGSHGRGGRGGRLGRLFAHGDLHFVVLHLIAEKPRHGYEMIKAIEDMVAGAYSPSPGTIYPALALLEEQGFVDQLPSEGSKKLFAITDEGRAYLVANAAALETLLARMTQARAEGNRAFSPQIGRAVENLKLALGLKRQGSDLSDAQIRLIVDALDEAARKIEQA